MTPGARVSAAIEVIADIEARRRPAGDALKEWGLAHRFAGSADRAAIAGLVYDALRRRASSAQIMGDESARAVVLGALRLARSLDSEAIARLLDGSRFAPPPLTPDEQVRLSSAELADARPWVRGDYPQWLDPYLSRTFGEDRAAEGAQLLRVLGQRAQVGEVHAGREHRPVAAHHDHPHGCVVGGRAEGLPKPADEPLVHRVALLRARHDDVPDGPAILDLNQRHVGSPRSKR
jgi:16S rRNA (cytosine967-C5)-methyltransferase